MSYKTFRMWQGIIGLILGGIIGASVGMGNWVIPIITVIISIIIILILRRKVREIVTDERIHIIVGKAARLTLQIVTIGMAVIGAVILIVSRGGSPALTQVGFAFEYATCALLLISSVAYTYYNRKLGGNA